MTTLPPPHSDRIAKLEKQVALLIKDNENLKKRVLGYESEDFKRKRDVLVIKRKLKM
jgi:hypothetical protein